jgi:hypothetical protein
LQLSRDNSAGNWFEGPVGARVLREETALARLALDDVFGFELLQVGTWGLERHLLDGARTQHTTLFAPDLAPGVTLCAPLDSLAVCLRLHRRDFSAAYPGAGRRPVCRASRGRARAVRRGLLDDLRLQPVQRLGCAASVRPILAPPGIPTANAAHALRAPAARLDGVAGLRGGERVRIPRADPDDAPAAPSARRIVRRVRIPAARRA